VINYTNSDDKSMKHFNS